MILFFGWLIVSAMVIAVGYCLDSKPIMCVGLVAMMMAGCVDDFS